MTPVGIATGRGFESIPARVALPAATETELVKGNGNRVALAVAGLVNADWTSTVCVIIGPKVDGAIVPVATLTAAHPSCYLDVSHLGNAIFAPLFALGNMLNVQVIGTVDVRQNRPLGDK